MSRNSMNRILLMLIVMPLIAGCPRVRTPRPKFKPTTICSSFMKKIDDLYQINCYCASYDVETTSAQSDYEEVDPMFCNKGQQFTNEYFFEEFEVKIRGLQQWYRDNHK